MDKKTPDHRKEVVLDTNFLLLPYQFKIDVFDQLSLLLETGHILVVSTPILRELEAISRVKGPRGMAARFGLKLLKAKKAKVVETKLCADDWIAEYSHEKDIAVCSNDYGLRRRLKKGTRMIGMKSRSRIGIL
ncbi:MAG: PIN domain-containing protein [Candidatus Bilamarchaeaceae archaeon]